MPLPPLRHLLLALLLLAAVSPAFAAGDEELGALGFATEEVETQPLTPRTPRPASQIAENVTVITADDILRLNAHTLVDVLQTVPGIQMDFLRGAGGHSSYFNIHGALAPQVLVLLDGIPLNGFNENKVLPQNIPVQQIERIEIIKGAASAAWGSALGGVINVITKSPDPERAAAGMVSGSFGEWNTTDARGEVSGTLNRFGYYLTAGNLHTDGMNPNTSVNTNTLYGKLTYLLPNKGLLTFGYGEFDANTGQDQPPPPLTWYDSARDTKSYGFLTYSQPLGERLTLDATGYFTRLRQTTAWGDLIGGVVFPWQTWRIQEEGHGVKTSLTWGDSRNNLVTGFDIEHSESKVRNILTSDPPVVDKDWTKWAAHANGTLSFGKLTILPGIRYDHTGLVGGYLSYTLGATYQLSDATVLRAYGARGYSLPNLQLQHDDLSTTRTVQVGIETTAIPYLWFKGTLFYNRLDDIEYTNDPTIYNQTKQGFELEGRTTPVHGFSLVGGYTFLDAKDRDTGERLQTNPGQSVPRQSLKLGLNYDQKNLGLRGALTGNYVWWNTVHTGTFQGRYNAMVWDLHLNWQLFPQRETSPELFFSLRNLFNGDQSVNYLVFPNAPRWFEGGLRFKF